MLVTLKKRPGQRMHPWVREHIMMALALTYVVQLWRRLLLRHRLESQRATQKSSDLSKPPWETSPQFVPTTRFAYDPLLTTIISHNFQETVAVGNKISNLLSRIVALEDCFDSPPSGVPEQRHRVDLIWCGATVPPLLPVLISS